MSIMRAALYCRVSTEEQALHGYSIETQKENLSAYCEQNDIVVVDYYIDEGISGTKPPSKRPALQRLMQDVEYQKIDIILFTKLDRWFRSVKEYFKVQDILDKHHVEWNAIHEGYDTTTANGKLAITIFLAIAQNERDKTSERIKVVFDHKRKNKELCYGSQACPTGYTGIRDENGSLHICKDPKTKDAVADFWNVLIKTYSLKKAMDAVYINHDINVGKAVWYKVRRNPLYTGEYYGVKNYCEPYVSPEDFKKYQEAIPVKEYNRERVYLFRNLIVCPNCGRHLAGGTTIHGEKKYISYRCPNRKTSRSCVATLSEPKIENMLMSELSSYIKTELANVSIKPKKTKKTTNELKKLVERQRRLTVAYVAGAMNDDDYLRQNNEISQKIERMKSAEEDIPVNTEKLKELLSTDFESLYNQMTREEKQTFWTRLIKEIRIEDRKIVSVKFR